MKSIGVVLPLLLLSVWPAAAARAADDPGISLHVQNQTPQQVFEKLFEGLSLNACPVDSKLWQVATKPVTLDIQNGKFWDVITQLDRATGVSMTNVNGDEVVLVMDHGAAARLPSALVGPLRVSAIAAESQYDVEFVKHIKADETDTIQLLLEADPRYHAVALEPADGGSDENAKPPPPSGGKQLQRLTELTNLTSGRAKLSKKGRSGAAGQIAGEVQFPYLLSHVTAFVPLTVALPDTPAVTKDFGDFRCSIKLHAVGGGYGADILLKNMRLDIRNWRRLSVAMDACVPVLSDAAGNRYLMAGRTARVDDDSMTCSIEFTARGATKAPGEPQKLLCNMPVKVASELITIELKDIPLP